MSSKSSHKIAKINQDALELLMVRDDFQEEVSKIRDYFDIQKMNAQSATDWVLSEISGGGSIAFYEQVGQLLRKFKLSNNFKESIVNYILIGDYIKVPASNYAIDLSSVDIKVIIYQKPTQSEWKEIKESVNDLITKSKNKSHIFLEKFNYPHGTTPLKPKPKLSRNLEILDDIKNNSSYETIEAKRFDENDDFVNTAKSKKNIGNIKTTKNRFKKKGYI